CSVAVSGAPSTPPPPPQAVSSAKRGTERRAQRAAGRRRRGRFNESRCILSQPLPAPAFILVRPSSPCSSPEPACGRAQIRWNPRSDGTTLRGPVRRALLPLLLISACVARQAPAEAERSEEHTSELQSREN